MITVAANLNIVNQPPSKDGLENSNSLLGFLRLPMPTNPKENTSKTHLPYSFLDSDAKLENIQRRWEGKSVWGYGGIEFICQSGCLFRQFSLKYHQPANIRQIRRIQLQPNLYIWTVGGITTTGEDLHQGRAYPAKTALELTFTKLENLENWASGSSVCETPAPQTKCEDNLTIVVLDEAHMKRLFSLTPPSKALQALENRRDIIGLTKWQFIWLRGFPQFNLGTVSEVFKDKVWEYSNIPFPAEYTFSDGKLQSFYIPRLP